jgi:hypothetical protein
MLTGVRFLLVIAGVVLSLLIAATALAWQGRVIGEHYWATPNPVPRTGELRVCGKGVAPYATVSVQLGYTLSHTTTIIPAIAEGQVDGDGSFCVTGRMPDQTRAGNGELEIEVESGGVLSIKRVALSVLQ